MKNFTETLTRVMDFASTENWMDCGDYLIFGWDEYIKESGQTLDPIKQEGLNSRDLGRALFRIKQAWVSQSMGDTFSALDQYLNTEERRYCLELGTAHELVERLPEIVRRCEHLNVLTVDESSGSSDAQILTAYFKGATLCYLLGLNSASALLLRSALELALETTLQTNGKRTLEKLINRAYEKGIFGCTQKKRACRIRMLGNDVAHKKKIPDEEETRDCLGYMREFLPVLLGAS